MTQIDAETKADLEKRLKALEEKEELEADDAGAKSDIENRLETIADEAVEKVGRLTEREQNEPLKPHKRPMIVDAAPAPTQVDTIGTDWTPPVAAVEAEIVSAERVTGAPGATIGRIVIYRRSDGVEQAAIVAGRRPWDERPGDVLDLAVFDARVHAAHGLGRVIFQHDVKWSGTGEPGTWSWPARA